MYVFKIIPFLNPDGVYNGCYRSDTMGHNLNRVYLGPCKDIHPSIYAVRKLIMYVLIILLFRLGTNIRNNLDPQFLFVVVVVVDKKGIIIAE